MKKIILILLCMVTLLNADLTRDGIYIDESSLASEETDSKLQNLLAKMDYDHFIDSIEIDFADWKSCGTNNFGLPGIAGCYDEPIIMADYSKEPLKIQSLGISLNNDIAKSGYSRKSEASSNMYGHTNFIKFPILGMWTDSKMFCMTKGDLALSYLSAFDPLYDGMYTKSLFADINAFFKPHLMLLGFVDCAASSIDNYTSPLSKITAFNARLRMASPHYMGCWNAFPMGGWATQSDPLLGAASAIGYGLASSMRIGALGKTMRIPGMDGAVLPDTMCGEKVSPIFVKPQFLYQLIDPTASKTIPLGSIASEWANFKNTPQSLDESAFWIWQRKCLYMGAAKCSK